MQVQSYLFFDGRCEEALNFYTKAIGAKIEMLMRFKDSPEGDGCGPNVPPPEKIMHACVKVGDTSVMASDGHCQGKPSFQGFALSLNAATVAEGEKLFKALAEGGQVQQPLIKTFFAESFGMVADRFGVSWMIVVMSPHQAAAQ
jgi:PhnB protein